MARRKAEPEAPSPDNGAATADAVVIVVSRDVEGNASTSIATTGDVRVTEVPTLLELALMGFRHSHGLDE